MQKLWIVLGISLALAGFGVGCGDDSGDGGDGGAPNVEPASEMITAAEGGMVATSGASVNIPADALDEDTEVTIEVVDPVGLPDADMIGSVVYDFGPDGTTFSTPVTLTIELDGSVPDGMSASIAWLDSETDAWVKLADSELADGEITATTDHFTPFAIIFTAQGQTAGSCDGLDFEACGGDIEGTWEFSLGCLTLPADLFGGGEDSPFAMCEEQPSVSATIDLTGTAVFNADGTFTMEQNVTTDIAYSIPTVCLMGATCADISGDEMPFVDTGDACESNMEQMSMDSDMGTYELDENTLITTSADATEADAPNEYCVEGDVLTVRVVDVDDEGNETDFFFQATRR